MFQQNSYRPERYMRWLRKSGDTTSYVRLFGIFILLFCLSGIGHGRLAVMCTILFSIFATVSLAKREYKKPLVFTKRAVRIFVAACILTALLTAIAEILSELNLFGETTLLYTPVVVLLLAFCFSHFILLASNFILKPVENHINKKFLQRAEDTLSQMHDLKIIGITGSYGKTSTKHFLYRILSEHYETLMTPGSFNTTLGVVRTINENLKPYHQVFIAEMGAKQTGDIKEICDIVHPLVGIVTAVGPQHLETFGKIENVLKTKFELVDSLPASGFAIINNDYPLIAERDVSNCHVERYGNLNLPGTGYLISDIRYLPHGSTFALTCPDDRVMRFETRLLGEHNISNLAAAIITALILDVPEDKIKYSVSHIESVEHRLSLRRHPNGLTILDDAFNSNPAGASMAVDVLARMEAGRRIIITPGMIELGSEQERLNIAFGETIARADIDYVAIVGSYNKESILSGLNNGGVHPDKILFFDTFLQANAWMLSFSRPGDVVLIENDLPDTFK